MSDPCSLAGAVVEHNRVESKKWKKGFKKRCRKAQYDGGSDEERERKKLQRLSLSAKDGDETMLEIFDRVEFEKESSESERSEEEADEDADDEAEEEFDDENEEDEDEDKGVNSTHNHHTTNQKDSDLSGDSFCEALGEVPTSQPFHLHGDVDSSSLVLASRNKSIHNIPKTRLARSNRNKELEYKRQTIATHQVVRLFKAVNVTQTVGRKHDLQEGSACTTVAVRNTGRSDAAAAGPSKMMRMRV